MEQFDQIMPLDYSGNEVSGYIKAMNEEFYIHLIIQENVYPKKVSLKGCEKLYEVLKPILDGLEQNLHHIDTITEMLYEIQNALEQQIRARGPNQSIDGHAEYKYFFEQLQECGWDKVHFISPDFHELQLKAVDDSDREHILKIWIPDKFPNEEPKYESDLPQEFQYRWLPGDTLLNMFIVFQETLNMYAEFWNIMDELDKNTWILEPEVTSRKDCKRRIALASGVSLLLVINPLMPTSIPTCHYLGPERIVEPMRSKFNKNIHLWSEFDSVLANLQQIFGARVSITNNFC
ncbi:E3 ubiquitin-protein ligase FANCL like protein [Argiope bruennichi]|uniref:E3 ubiquitin-protein ligase FANCL like protein n=1 Tax=Argiope bruennichi TaxID=94029 RepID=A0A8T0EXX2_ARGBR|nr:E3 ubiquitin-protein ligase FANCL like protein [Argiope bruennichi]